MEKKRKNRIPNWIVIAFIVCRAGGTDRIIGHTDEQTENPNRIA
jgi:hypothetical protein